ncbi:putative gustatory receptor 93c [Drosophila kikkawai]|uniref:Gustatory receptor 93c n=1 Tax=Drosophila kikkawai TaxID=30033 RepID=A0A6P4I1S8_DROKI
MVWRLVPLCVNAYTYSLFIWKLANLVDQVLNGARLVIITSCCLSLIHLQIFHGEEVIRIMNQYLHLFNRVSALFIRSEIGFGGGRELCLILLSLGCQTLFSVISISYKMIADRQFYQFWIWFWFVKTVLDMLVLSLAIEGAVNKFNFIREIILDMFLLSERTEWNRKMELFITHLNLYQFRVSLMGLFDVSNKFFPVVVTGMITYLVFIVQFVMQLKI